MSVGRAGSSVHSGTTSDFSQEEAEALRKDESTSNVVNQARRQTGQKGGDVAVRGDDKTLNAELEHKKTHLCLGKPLLAAIDALHIGAAIGKVPHVVHSKPGIVAAGVATLIGIHAAMWEMQEQKDGTRDAATRDTLHAGLLMSLELPQGFVDQKTSELGVGTNRHQPASKVADQIDVTPGLRATAQRHCDEGVVAARAFAGTISKGMTKENIEAATMAYLAQHPNIAERYNNDAAFRAGFDGYAWAKANNPADADTVDANVKAREQHYAAAHVSLRV